MLPRSIPHWCAQWASGQTSDSGKTVETSIETQNSLDAVDLHHGEVYCISRGQAFLAQDDLLRSFDCRLVHRKYFIDDSQQGMKRRLNSIRPPNRNITVKYLLQHFRVGRQPLSAAHQFIQPTLRIGLVRMGGSH